jgi:ureidoglycolate hydrolase
MPAIKEIDADNFRRYGWLIEYPDKKSKDKKKNLFRIVLREKDPSGWRIAYLIVRDKAIHTLEQHPESYESFEPVSGKSLLYVALAGRRGKIECFLLDKPVILKKGIWHGVVTLEKETEIKITENAQVKCVYWPLGFELNTLPINPAID